MLSEGSFNESVVSQRNSLFIDFSISSLVDKFFDGFSGRITKLLSFIPEGDVWLNSSHEVDGGFVDSDKGSVVELSEPEESQDADGPRVKMINTANSNDKCDFGLSWDVDLSSEFSLPSGVDFVRLGFAICGFLILDSFKEFLPLSLVGSSASFSLFLESSGNFSISFFLLFETFRFGNVRHYHNLNNNN